MGEDAFEAALMIQNLWRAIEKEEYGSLKTMFALGAQYVDPVHGAIVGDEAIAEHLEGLYTYAKNKDSVDFMGGGKFELMELMDSRSGTFTLCEVCEEGEKGWASWQWNGFRGEVDGVSVYRLKNGKITYCRDYVCGTLLLMEE